MRTALPVLLLMAGCSPQMAATVDSPEAYPPRQIMPLDPVGIRPIPEIPVALRGCWYTPGPEDPEEPGAAHRIIVTATTIQQIFPDSEPQGVATADFVEQVSETSIEGRFSARDGDGQATVATSLSLLDVDTLRRAEGDAGSDHYTRCED